MSDDDPYNGWTVGRLRKELEGLPADIPLIVNVTVKVPGEAGSGFIPLAIDDAGFTVTDPGADPHEEILRIFNIETVNDDGLIFVPGPPPQD